MLTSKPLYVAILFCLLEDKSLAQEKTADKAWVFHSFNQIGLLEAETGSAFQIQSVNGMQYKSWFGGFGVGLDYYRFRSIPFFLDLKKSFQNDGNGLFLYADGGIHFLWPLDSQKTYAEAAYKNSFYADIGMGYRLLLVRKTSLLFSAGYTYKKVVEQYPVNCDLWFGPCHATTDRYDYDLNRLSIKIGVSF
jgi:hypothetical protein